MNKILMLFVVFLTGIPVQMSAMSDEQTFYNDWYGRINTVLDNVSTSQALAMVDEVRDYAEEHDSKYGFYIVTILNAHIAKDMGMTDRAEELMQQSFDYQKRYLSKIRPMARVYDFMSEIYEDKKQGEKAIRLLEEALKQSDWSISDQVLLMATRCRAVASMVPVDTARFMAYHRQLHAFMEESGYKGDAAIYTECYHAQFLNDYQRLLALAQGVTDKRDRLLFKIAAYDGLGRNQEAIDSFKIYKAWSEEQFNEDLRNQAEVSALELESTRAENEADTLRLKNQRQLLVAIVCGLVLFTAFLVVYLWRRQRQMRELQQAYDQLEEVTTQKERIESELRIARDIQMSMVPHDFPELNNMEIYACMTPAKAVGGDLYDFFVRDGQLFFCIGDVSGKGVPAALFMMMTRSFFRSYSSSDSRPDSIMAKINHSLSENNESCMFVTLFIGILDMSSGQLRYCNAGHEAPVIIGKEVRRLPVDRVFPAGAYTDTDYQTQTALFDEQTTLFFYTDGLNEAMNADGQMFGEERILDEANKAVQDGKTSPRAMIERMTQAVGDYVGDTEQRDDLTMLAISFR